MNVREVLNAIFYVLKTGGRWQVLPKGLVLKSTSRRRVPLVLDRRTRRLFPFIERVFAGAGYQGPRTAAATSSEASRGSGMIDAARDFEHYADPSPPSFASH